MSKKKKSTNKVEVDSSATKEKTRTTSPDPDTKEPKKVMNNKSDDVVEIKRSQLDQLMARLKTVEDMAGDQANKGKIKEPQKFKNYIYRISVWGSELVKDIKIVKEAVKDDKGRTDFNEIFNMKLLDVETGETREIETTLVSYIKNRKQVPAKMIDKNLEGESVLEIINKTMVRGKWEAWEDYNVPDNWLGVEVKINSKALNS